MGTTKYLALLIVMFTSAAFADDCMPIADALAKQVHTSFRVIMSKTEWDQQGRCKGTVGLSRHNAGELSYHNAPDSGAFPDISACRALGPTKINGEAAEHFYAVVEIYTPDPRFAEFWISSTTGLILKRFESQPDEQTTLRYDYKNLDSIF
jgi:hypothetical protein